MDEPRPNELLPTARVAQALGLTPNRVRQLMADGRLPYVATPLGRLVTPAAVEAERQRRLGPP